MLSTKEQMQRVKQYLDRVKEGDRNAPNYPLEKIAVYKFVSGGNDERGNRDTVGYFEGRFVDVVATIVTMSEMGGWWLDSDSVWNPNAGYIVAEAPPYAKKVPKVNGLVEYLKQAKSLEKKKSDLEKKINEFEGE